MDHAEARELLDVAAAEPGGLDRLIAGDTPAAIALAGHLAGCPDCTEEFTRLRRSSTILREVISTQPPAELRERTLAMVRALGRPRGAGAGAARETAITTLVATSAPVSHAGSVDVPARPARIARPGTRPRLGWLAAAAVLILVSGGVTGFAVASFRDTAQRQASFEPEGLPEVAAWTVRLDRQPDVRHVLLTGNAAGGGTTFGTLMFSPRTHELVVIADGLPEPPPGHEYRCFVEVAGSRQRLGKMYVSGDLAYWAGAAVVLGNVPSGSLFGVTLVDVANTGGAGPTILSGTLQAT